MENEERLKKLEAGKAKLAEYRQRKAYADSQKKQKKKKKKKAAEDSEGDSQGRVDVEPDQPEGGVEVSGEGRDGSEEGTKDPRTTEFTFAKTLRSGETVKHDQTYTIEPESEVSTTAEDYSSEEEAESVQQETKGGTMQDMEDALAAKTQAVDELKQELEEIRSGFGTEGIQQLQDFEAALKQRDGIITQLTANLQQSREEKDEIVKEFLELTEQSQKLHIQFQQLQAGETLRNTSHSSAAADLLQARQQLIQYQQQLEEMNVEARRYQESSSEQQEQISQLQHQISEMEMSGRRSDESFTQRINEKDLLIAEQERVLLGQEQSLMQLRETEESFAQTLKEKNLFISEQTTIITEHERSLTLLQEEFAQAGRTAEETSINESNEKDVIIAEQERVISERDCAVTKLKDELESSEKCLHDVQQQVAAKELELERCLNEWESTKSVLQNCKCEMESYKLELEKEQTELENCKGELAISRQKERMSSTEIMQLMGTVEDLQKRCHQDSLSESDTLQRMEEETVRKLELLRAELDEMYGQQIVQMKQELHLQHVANEDQMIQQHCAEIEILKAQHQSQMSAVRTVEVDTLHAKVRELQETLVGSQAMHNKVRHELRQVTQEKLNLQAKVDNLLQDLHSANEKVELVSHSLISQETQQTELQHLQDTIDNLRHQLAAAEEAAQETEAKHESETTNYKIKLEMLEREKDAVLGRMAESQEAELERLRTQLLFSHEEELINLREELQREGFLNTENLLNEVAIKHERVLDEQRIRYEQELRLLQIDKAGFVTERDELLHQILALKEELKMDLHSSNVDELVQQLQELQVEVEELRKGGEEQARMENEIKTLLIKMEELENQTKEKEECWENKVKKQELEKNMLIESNNALKEELESGSKKIETLTAHNLEIQQLVDELSEEIEKQRTTFSFAEKNFEQTYQELEKEYKCLIKANTQLEERTLKETLEFEAKISSLQSQIHKQEESSKDDEMEETDGKALIEKDTTELMEKLNVTLSEKESLAGRLSEVTEKLMFTESKVGQLDGELMKVRQENKTAIAQNESLKKELEIKKEIIREQVGGQDAERKAKLQQGEQTLEPVASVCSLEDHHLRIQSLQEEVGALQSLLQAAEAGRDSIRQTLEVQRLSQTPSPAAAHRSGEGPVEGRSPLQKPTASGSSRRKRRQRSKQERKPGTVISHSREERQREEEEEETAVEEEKAVTSVAEQELQAPMESQVTSHSQRRADMEDSTDGYQGDGDRDHINKRVTTNGTRRHMEPVVQLGAEEDQETTEHGECRLQMEAQRISLSQIHAAQLELLQERTDAHTHSLELKLQHLKEHHGQDEPKIFKYQNMLQAVSEECSEIILSFRKMFGERVLEIVDTEGQRPPSVEGQQPPSVERPETSESPYALLEARELYKDLQLVKERIEQEHERLSQLQILLRADGNKVMELQMAYDELKSSSEKEISDLRMQGVSLGSAESKDPEEQAGVPSTSLSEDLQRLKAEAQQTQLQLEESHRQQMEHLRAHYQQQAAETEERYTTELLMLEHRLQEATGTHAHFSLSSVPESSSERVVEHREELKHDLSEEGSSEGTAEPRWPIRSVGLTAQLQALRKALYHKYVHEVTALKEQHGTELRRLREEGEQERKREECQEAVLPKLEQDSRGINASRLPAESLWADEQLVLEEKNWEKVEEEVAKAIVQMSVEFAQQSELARIIKRSGQTTTSMQTQLDEDKVEKREKEEQTLTASVTTSSFLEEVVRETLEKELEERNTEIQKLKEQLQKTESAPEQALQKTEEGPEVGEDEDSSRVEIKKAGGQTSSSQDEGESSDKDTVTTERNLLCKANEKLCQVLVDVLKTTAAAEETMGLHMQSLRDSSSGGHQDAPSHLTTQGATWQGVSTEPIRPRVAGQSTERYQDSGTVTEDVSLWSGEVEATEGLEMSQQMMDSLLLGAGTQLENEEYLTGISSRLQMALEKMLMAITDTTNQLEHARLTQTELMRESFRHNQEMSELLQKQEELQERAMEEARAREQLALELHRAEGLIDGYTGERAALEEQLRQKEELQLSLEQDLQVTSSRLHELEQEKLQMQEERELLSRQQDAMREHAGPRELRLVEAAMVAAPEADLLEETEKLMKEKVEVQRQAEKENADLFKQVKLLEAELEEQVNRVIELEQAQRSESGDLQQQIQALEKQLEKNRRFLDEQAVDREHERDFFQQEIHKLEQQLKNPQKLQAGAGKRVQQVDQLTSQLKEKADWCSELLLNSEQLRCDLGERDEEIDKLESRIRELEQALLASADSLEKTEQKQQDASVTEAQHSTLEAQLQTEREALDRKEKEICNLEEQLEQFREELENNSEEVQQLHMQLEIQRKELSSQQQYLETRDSMLQVMEEKDREIALLNEQISKLQHMETASDNKEIDERDELIKELESQVECMRSEQERLKRNNEDEIDQLNAVIDRLQQELTNSAQKQTTEDDEDTTCEPDIREWGPSKEEYDEMKQQMDLTTKELDTLKNKHSKLLETYLLLRDSAEAVAETEKLESSDGELQEALREKTAGLVVMQAQVQALEQSATSRVEELSHRIQELEVLVSEKDSELASCRPLVEQTQSFADGLQQKVSKLEENLREKVAAALVSQATLEAFQQQSQGSKEEQGLQRQAEPQVYDFGDFGISQMDFSGMGQARQVSTGKMVHLTQKLRELEVGLSGMQKDQELQKQLLSSSEEEVLEYERRLAVLMDLLSQMTTKTSAHQRMPLSAELPSADDQPAVSELLKELEEVRDEASVAKEQLSNYKESCSRLQEELQEKAGTIERLQDQLERASSRGIEETMVFELQHELTKVQNEAASTKEELNSSRESCEKLQELLQEREMTIAHLKGELFEVTAEEANGNAKELLQELQEVRNDVATTKEELNSYKQRCEKLEDELQIRELSISKFKEELQKVRTDMDTTQKELNNYRENSEKLEDELQIRELSISKFKEELQKVRADMDATQKELNNYRENIEKREDELQVRELSISKLNEELQEVRTDLDTTKEELNNHRENSEKLEEELQIRELSISKLNEELQEVRKDKDTTQKELNNYRENSEKLEDERQIRELSISKLNEELQEVRKDMGTTQKELNNYRENSEKLEEELQIRELSISKFKEELQEVRKDLDTTQKELKNYRENSEKLEDELQIRELSISKLNEELQEVRKDMDTTQKELNNYRENSEKLEDELQSRELSISKLNEELQEVRKDMDTTQKELNNYRENSEKLEDELQSRELSISKLNEELQEVRKDMDTTQKELNNYSANSEKLEDELQVRELSISKLNEELQEVRKDMDTTKELSNYRENNEKLKDDLQVRELSISKLKDELQEVRKAVDTTKEEVNSYRQRSEKLEDELQVRELSISKLKDELQEVRKAVDTTEEEVNSYRQRSKKLEDELQVRELSISKLKDELQEARTTIVKTADSASPSPAPSPQPVSSASSSNSATQPKRKVGKQPAGKGASAKDKSSLSRKNASQTSDKSRTPVLRSDSEQQQRVALTDSFTQTEALQMSDPGVHSKSAPAATKEEMEEVIGEFQEKIGQMQELHAAEILDMEARHISESDTLRRDTQALEDECKALKAVLDKLRSAEAPASRPDRPSSQFKDGYISDSSSDYSQRTGYDLPSLQQEFRTTPEGARRETDDPLPYRIKTLLREVHQEGMQVLSLSELPVSEGEPGSQFHVPGWAKEREALLANAESLKSLISQMQIHRETQTSGTVDWRGELLDAVRLVFVKERSVLKSALYSQLELMDTSDAIVHLNQLEHRLAEQDAQHREAMGTLYTADRSSLISEIRHLRNQLEQLSQGVQPAVSVVGEFSSREQREGGGADGAAEADELLVEELKGRLSQTKLELETTLKAQHKHLKEMEMLRAEVSQKAAEMDVLNDQLSEERKRSRELQWAMEKERCRTGRNEESKQEELEDLRLSLEEQQSRVAELTSALEQERLASSQLVQQTEQEHLGLHRRLQELQVQLDTERAKTLEMSSALGRQRELRTGVCTDSGPSNDDQAEEDRSRLEEEGSLVEKLQRELDDKYAQVVHLLSQVEAQKLEVVRKQEELTLTTQRSRREEEALLEARAQLESLGAQVAEAQEKLEREGARRRTLEEEKERLEERLAHLGEQGGGERAGSRPLQADGHSSAHWHSKSTDRTKDWVFQQKGGTGQMVSSGTPAVQEVTRSGHTGGPHHGPWHAIDKILGKLHLISSKICAMASKTPGSLTTEVDTEELSWVQSNINEVITMLQQSPGLPSVPESLPLLAGSSSNSLTERLLRQNAELTGFVSRLTEEKNDLRNHTLRLEEELRRYRQARLSSGDSSGDRRGGVKSDSAGLLLSQEREVLMREKVRLERALHLSQAQVARLRGEIRTDTLRDITGPEADNAALKRIYGKYLRSESFRKALIYQKKYLLLLLGGFQECEEATLSLISRMGGRSSISNLDSLSPHRRGLTRFRSAVRVSIALSRMRFLVKRWHKATGMTSGGVIKTGAGQIKGTGMRDSLYFNPGSTEVYRERGGEGGGVFSSRGRSGRESPRSAVSCTHHRFHMAGDAGALTCSHLQNYDPDRALTDYISRLEALQRRLGSVTSGSSSHAQMHFGLRR